MLRIYLSTYFLIVNILSYLHYAFILSIYLSTCLIVFSFSMQVIEQYEQRQGKLGDLA